MSNRKIITYCDNIVAFCLYCLIFYLPFSIAGVEISTGLGFIFWTLKRAFGFRTQGLWGMVEQTRLNKALFIFFITNALSVVFSMYWEPSLKGILGKELKFLIIFFMVAETLCQKNRLRIMFYVFMFSAALIVLDTYVQGVRGVDFLRNHSWMRARAGFGTANDFGGWLIVMIPLLTGFLMSKSKEWMFWSGRAIVGVLILFLLVCLLFTYSRGAWVGLFIGLLSGACYVFWKIPAKNKLLTLSISAIVILIFIIIFPHIRSDICLIGSQQFKSGETFSNRVKVLGNSWSVRIQLWKEAVCIIKDHPLLGTGLNTYDRVVQSYKTFYKGGAYAHNSFLQMAAETGILGLLSFLWVLFEYFRAGFNDLRQTSNSLILGLMTGILAFLVQSFVDTNLYALQLVVLFWFILGLTFAVTTSDETHRRMVCSN